MSRAQEPHSPEIELAARRTLAPLDAGVLTPELVKFCQSGISIVLAACLPGGLPACGQGLACRIGSGHWIRIILGSRCNQPLLAILKDGGWLAVTFTRPYTHRSIQLKGSQVSLDVTCDEDVAAALAQAAGLHRELVEAGYPPHFCTAYCHVEAEDLTALVFRPDSAFVQTPGPGAGAQLTA